MGLPSGQLAPAYDNRGGTPLIRLPKPALALLATVALVAAACGGGSATAAPAGSSATSTSTSTSTGGAGASVAPTLNPNDPNSVISQVIAASPDAKSFHIRIALNGTIKAAALQSADSSLGAAITSDLKLDGTAIEGDVDVVNQAGHLALTVPAMKALGGVPITGDLILVDNVLYAKATLLGPKYTTMKLSDLGSLTGSLPVAVPTPGASALTGVADQVAALRKQLDDAGAKVTLVGVEKIGDQDADHLNVSVPLDMLNSQIAAAAASDSPSMKIDSASVDLWVYTDGYRLAQVEVKGASSSIGSLDLVITVTNYDKAVTVTAPPASEVQTAAP